MNCNIAEEPAIVFSGKHISLPPDRFVRFALDWAIVKALAGQWDHVKEILHTLEEPIEKLIKGGD